MLNRDDLTEDQNGALSRRLGTLLRFVSAGCRVSMVMRTGRLISGWSCGDLDHPHCARCGPIVHEILALQQSAERSEGRARVGRRPLKIRERYRFKSYKGEPSQLVEVRAFKVRCKDIERGTFHVYDEDSFRSAEKIDE